MMVPQRKTVDGFEEHFGLNYLGHFLLTNLLLDTLQESGCPGRSARVVTVSSATHYVGELDLGNLQSRWVCAPGAGGAWLQAPCPGRRRDTQGRALPIKAAWCSPPTVVL